MVNGELKPVMIEMVGMVICCLGGQGALSLSF